KVTSSGGDVSVDAAHPPSSLDAESSAGDVSVTLPGQMSYDVETDSSIGDVTVGVPERDGSMYEVRAFSSAGRVAVTARGGGCGLEDDGGSAPLRGCAAAQAAQKVDLLCNQHKRSPLWWGR